MTENQIAQRGIEAARLLENPLLNEIWEGSKNEAIDALESCSLTKEQAFRRDELIWHLQMVKKQKAMMIGMIEQGKFAQYKINLDEVRNESAVKRFARRVVNG